MSCALLPPWEGPDLLADAKAAALKAGETITTPIKPPSALSRPKPKELTWAHFQVKDPPSAAKPLASSSLPLALLTKIKQQNAITSAAAQAERLTSGKAKPARRARTFDGRATGRKPGSGGFRTSVLTSEQVVEIWNSQETGAALAKRLGVSHMTISNIRTGKSWGSLTGTLGELGVKLLRGSEAAALKPTDSQQASKN
jgi:hypothetical protein